MNTKRLSVVFYSNVAEIPTKPIFFLSSILELHYDYADYLHVITFVNYTQASVKGL